MQPVDGNPVAGLLWRTRDVQALGREEIDCERKVGFDKAVGDVLDCPLHSASGGTMKQGVDPYALNGMILLPIHEPRHPITDVRRAQFAIRRQRKNREQTMRLRSGLHSRAPTRKALSRGGFSCLLIDSVASQFGNGNLPLTLVLTDLSSTRERSSMPISRRLFENNPPVPGPRNPSRERSIGQRSRHGPMSKITRSADYLERTIG